MGPLKDPVVSIGSAGGSRRKQTLATDPCPPVSPKVSHIMSLFFSKVILAPILPRFCIQPINVPFGYDMEICTSHGHGSPVDSIWRISHDVLRRGRVILGVVICHHTPRVEGIGFGYRKLSLPGTLSRRFTNASKHGGGFYETMLSSRWPSAQTSSTRNPRGQSAFVCISSCVLVAKQIGHPRSIASVSCS